MICPKCKKNMVILIDERVLPHSWGGCIIYGCSECNGVYWERTSYGKKPPKKHIKKKAKKVKKKLDEIDLINFRPQPVYDPTHHHDNHLIN